MIIWRSVGVQALADALSIWANRQANKNGTPPRAAAPDPGSPAEYDGDRGTASGSRPKIVYNADRRG